MLLLRKLKQQGKEQMEERRPKLIQALKQMGDFYLQLKWDFQSWGKEKLWFVLLYISALAENERLVDKQKMKLQDKYIYLHTYIYTFYF